MKRKNTRVKQLLKEPLNKQASIAFICSFCLGDSLMSLVTVNNLMRNGYQVHVFGDYAYELRDWFPDFTIKPLISVAQQDILRSYDIVLHMYETPLSNQVSKWHSFSVTLSDSILYLADMTMTDIQVALCEQEFGLTNLVRINNIQPLSGLNYRMKKNRIVIHPTSSLARKNWPAKKFVNLSQRLVREGYDVHFIVSSSEKADWGWIEDKNINLPSFDGLSDVAKFIYESGYFIGNDSGIGHLASNLGIPTVSIILRKGVAKQWRPTWSPGRVVLSPTWLNPRPIKEKLWKIFTRVTTVKSEFDDLRKECGELL